MMQMNSSTRRRRQEHEQHDRDRDDREQERVADRLEQSAVGERGLFAEQSRPVIERVTAREARAEGELDHRDDRDREHDSNNAEDDPTGNAAGFGAEDDGARPLARHRCHRDARVCSTE
jgi:hypothetical protein